MMRLGDVLKSVAVPERINSPASERFVTVKLRCEGAVERLIKDGKTPVPFTGYRAHAGDFIYSRIDARNGAFALVPDNLDGAVVSKDFPLFRVRDEIIDRQYLLHFMRSGRLEQAVRKLSFGATNRQRISESVFLNLPISVPSIGEQRRIAAILDQADAIRTKRRQLLAHLDALVISAFDKMVLEGSKIELVPLGSIVDLHSGSTPSKKQPELWSGTLPWYSPKDFKRPYLVESIDHLNEHAPAVDRLEKIPSETVALVVRGMILAHTAPVCMLRNSGIINQDIRALIPKAPIDPFYLLWALRSRSQRLLDLVSSSAHGTKRIETRDLQDFLVPVASHKEQAAFRKFAERWEAQRMAINDASDRDDALFASLQSRAFKGEL